MARLYTFEHPKIEEGRPESEWETVPVYANQADREAGRTTWAYEKLLHRGSWEIRTWEDVTAVWRAVEAERALAKAFVPHPTPRHQ